jgi:hypothetical protein
MDFPALPLAQLKCAICGRNFLCTGTVDPGKAELTSLRN